MGTVCILAQMIWPPSIIWPTCRTVYLDLNHWISLAKAEVGHPDGERFQPALEAARQAAEFGDAVFPISAVHYMEIEKIKSDRQRRDLADVIETISGFQSLADRALVARLEVEAALDQFVGPRSQSYTVIPLVGFGSAWTLGKRGLRLDGPGGEDLSEQIPEALTRMFERRVLEGPQSEAERDALVADEWDPRAAIDIQRRRAQAELEQVERFNQWAKGEFGEGQVGWPKDMRRSRGRDVAGTRYLLIELQEYFLQGSKDRGAEIEDALESPEHARRFIDSMPSANAAVTLMTEYHSNPELGWKHNDISDIDAISYAIAYCNVVVTDKKVAHHANGSGLSRRMQTATLADLRELPAVLSGSE